LITLGEKQLEAGLRLLGRRVDFLKERPSCVSANELFVASHASGQRAADVLRLVVWSKIDLTATSPGLLDEGCGNISAVRLSVNTGEGLLFLRHALADFLYAHRASDASKPEIDMLADDTMAP
jgi:hypothetical protein